MSAPATHFKHCPACGEALDEPPAKRLVCPGCGFTYYFNPTIGLMGFIENDQGQILLIERAKEPAKGKLAPPGGFADFGESAEEALSREVREETGLDVSNWRYLTSAVNHYSYKGVTYPVMDLAFTARIESGRELDRCTDETLSVKWVDKDSVDPGDLAFPSMREALRRYRSIQ